ncbi:MAG: hypothetical protein GWP08_10465 [Nitrospiraceae bacterium]|nr:hypothetical protein [Nitrospiraceae bacterium]
MNAFRQARGEVYDMATGTETQWTSKLLTQSRLKVWWLTTFCGWHVSMETDEPKPGLFGTVWYARRWWLEPSRGPKRR